MINLVNVFFVILALSRLTRLKESQLREPCTRYDRINITLFAFYVFYVIS